MTTSEDWAVWSEESAEIARLTFPAAAEAARMYEAGWVAAVQDAILIEEQD